MQKVQLTKALYFLSFKSLNSFNAGNFFRLFFPLSLILSFISSSVCSQIIRKPIPDKVVVLTFDDAPVTHFTTVAPLLKKYNFHATFYVCEFPPNYADTSKYMTWKQIQSLNEMGFEIGNHTNDHKHVTKLNKQQLIDQLTYVEDKCKSLNIPKPVTFAYPSYAADSAAVQTLKEKGYVFARAGEDRAYDPTKDSPLLVPGFTTTATNKADIMKALSQAKDGKIVVLTIHGVPDYEHPWVTTPPELFEEYLQYLKDNHYKVLAMKDLLAYINVSEALKIIRPDFHKKSLNK